jgi:hypothetical protein
MVATSTNTETYIPSGNLFAPVRQPAPLKIPDRDQFHRMHVKALMDQQQILQRVGMELLNEVSECKSTYDKTRLSKAGLKLLEASSTVCSKIATELDRQAQRMR